MPFSIFSTAWLLKLFGTTEFTTATKTKWQRKIAVTNDSAWTTGNNIPELTFNNLVSGKNYRLSFRLRFTSTAAAANTTSFEVQNGGVSINSSGFLNTEDGNHTVSGSIPFTASAADLEFIAISGISNVFFISGEAVLEELPNHEETTQWT